MEALFSKPLWAMEHSSLLKRVIGKLDGNAIDKVEENLAGPLWENYPEIREYLIATPPSKLAHRENSEGGGSGSLLCPLDDGA